MRQPTTERTEQTQTVCCMVLMMVRGNENGVQMRALMSKGHLIFVDFSTSVFMS